MTPYDTDKYRPLGVGETVRKGHYMLDGVIIVPAYASIGIVIDQDTVETFLEELPAKDFYPSGAARSSSEGRGRFDLIPHPPMLALARRYEEGAKRFGDFNWLKGVPLSRILSSMRRHSSQVGYDFTEDHAAAVAWNSFAWITTIEYIRAGILPRELDDLGVLDKEVVR